MHRVLIKVMINWCTVHCNESYVNDLTQLPFTSPFLSSRFAIPFFRFTFSIPLCSLFSLPHSHLSAGDLPQVPSRSDSYSGSLPHWHEEGASVGSHRPDGAVRPLRAGGQKAQNWQEENPRYEEEALWDQGIMRAFTLQVHTLGNRYTVDGWYLLFRRF